MSYQEWTELEEEDHGHGADAGHALAEVVTTIGHVSIAIMIIIIIIISTTWPLLLSFSIVSSIRSSSVYYGLLHTYIRRKERLTLGMSPADP